MKLHLLSALALSFTLLSGAAMAAPNPGNKEEMRQLIIGSCNDEENKSMCVCLADNLAESFTEKDWEIMIAAVGDTATPPAGTTEEMLKQFTTKLMEATQACLPQE